MKTAIYIFSLFIFLTSCKTQQKASIITSKKEAQKSGNYSYSENKELIKPAKPTKQELKAIAKAKEIAKKDSIEKASFRTIVEEDTPQNFTPTFEVGDYIKEQILNVAAENLGVPYKSGGTTPAGFDCSGFVLHSFTPFEVELPRSSQEMARSGKRIPKKEAKRGDLIFFNTSGGGISHVGIITEVLDDNIKFIHSSSSQGVMYSSLKDNYYAKTFVQINRVIE